MQHAEPFIMCVLAAGLVGFCLPFFYGWINRRILRREDATKSIWLVLLAVLTPTLLLLGSFAVVQLDTSTQRFLLVLDIAALIGIMTAYGVLCKQPSVQPHSTSPS